MRLQTIASSGCTSFSFSASWPYDHPVEFEAMYYEIQELPSAKPRAPQSLRQIRGGSGSEKSRFGLRGLSACLCDHACPMPGRPTGRLVGLRRTTCGLAREAEIEAWEKKIQGSDDWANYLEASEKATEYLGNSMIRTVKTWGASLDEVTK